MLSVERSPEEFTPGRLILGAECEIRVNYTRRPQAVYVVARMMGRERASEVY